MRSCCCGTAEEAKEERILNGCSFLPVHFVSSADSSSQQQSTTGCANDLETGVVVVEVEEDEPFGTTVNKAGNKRLYAGFFPILKAVCVYVYACVLRYMHWAMCYLMECCVYREGEWIVEVITKVCCTTCFWLGGWFLMGKNNFFVT